LIEIDRCKDIGTESLPNPQAEYGRDVLSRVKAIIDDPHLLSILQSAVVGALNRIVKKLLPGAKGKISRFTAVGNPVMEHILMGISPASLGKVPYRPLFRESKRIFSDEIGLNGSSGSRLYTFPLISGFVGGDAIAVMLSTDLHKVLQPSIAIDVGTNSEVAIRSSNGLFVTSAAAGPAFEGGEIEHGMVAGKGAIERVRIDGDKVVLDVIGGVNPAGICGSGLLSIVSRLITLNIIDTSGRIKGRDEIAGNLANRIKEEDDGNSFILYRGANGEVVLTQRDVRAFQLAKSAIRAGISLLMDKAQVVSQDIKNVYIAGAFGSSLKKEDLISTGVLDRHWADRITFVGDAALDGARLVLCSNEKRDEVEEIAKMARYISLSGSRHFQKEFMKQMNF
jgi:uncharacterized 2Fe-2S/4Fe-4S cluster protein (DUF4445 family)